RAVWRRSRSRRNRRSSRPSPGGSAPAIARRSLPDAPPGSPVVRERSTTSATKRLRHALDEGAILDQDAARFGGAARPLRVLRVRGERLPVPLVGGEAREVDQRERRVGGAGELRRRVVAG